MRTSVRRAILCSLLSGSLAVLAAGCAGDDQQVRREAIKRGDDYLAKEMPHEAIIEYRKAIQRDRKDGETRRKLARAYIEAGDAARAYEAYSRAAELNHADVDSQVQAARLLIAAGQFEAARSAAERILARDPKSVEGLILLGHALAGLDLPKDALRKMEDAIELAPSDARGYAALGTLQFSLGARKDAEAAFTKAVAAAPRSRDARLALAGYYFAVRRPEDAEREFARAHELAPDDELTNRAIAGFYVNTGRMPEAEPYLKAAARAHERARLALADYYMLVNRLPEAEQALEGLDKRPDFTESVLTRRAAIRFAQGRRDDAHRIVDGMLEGKKPSARAFLLKARFLLAENRSADAVPLLRKAIALDPAMIGAHYALGGVLFDRRDYDGARAAFTEVIRLNPHATAARLQLSRVAMAAGDTGRAVEFAEQAASDNPEHAGARITLVRTLRASGDRVRAEAELDKLIAAHPKVAMLWIERGGIRFENRDAEGARQAFEKAAALAPDAIEPLAGLVSIDIAAGKLAEARRRVDARLAAHPDDSRLLVLAGRVAARAKAYADAERHLRRAIDKDPQQADAYGVLGQVLVNTGRLDDARKEFARLDASRPAAAQTMLGLIAAAQGRVSESAAHYERALKADPAAALAANNLAWVRLDEGNVEEAVRLGRIAQEQLPDRPEMNDTLGWMLHKAGRYDAALQYLSRALERSPSSALYHFHVGMAYIGAGQRARGEASLKRALEIDPAFPSHEQAKDALQRTAAVSTR